MTNGITGDLRIYLDRDDICCDKEPVDLIAWFEGHTLGENLEPEIRFTAKPVGNEEGFSENQWSISVSRLRSLIVMAEALELVANQQWRARQGASDE